jgi:GlpG protein
MREPGFVDLHTLTFGLIVISTLLTFASGFGSLTSSVTRTLEIAPIDVDGQFIRWEGLRAIERGEVWRLVTPIFLHFDLLHLVFNMLMLHSLGGLVERRRGWWRFLLLVLVLAVGSNLAEYYIEWSPAQSGLLQWKENPQFGGMSGVLYGLFGFAWMRGRFAPQQGMELSSQTVVVMLVWFVLCLAGIVGAVANMAHAGGLVLGIALGATALVWPGSRRSG